MVSRIQSIRSGSSNFVLHELKRLGEDYNHKKFQNIHKYQLCFLDQPESR